MTAEIIPFPSPRLPSEIFVEVLPPVGQTTRVPANVLTLAAVPADEPSNGVAVAAVTLMAACRELTASLATLGARCSSADALVAEMGDRADAIAANVKAVDHSAALISKVAAVR